MEGNEQVSLLCHSVTLRVLFVNDDAENDQGSSCLFGNVTGVGGYLR